MGILIDKLTGNPLLVTIPTIVGYTGATVSAGTGITLNVGKINVNGASLAGTNIKWTGTQFNVVVTGGTLLTALNTKLNVSAFNTYTGTTAPATYLTTILKQKTVTGTTYTLLDADGGYRIYFTNTSNVTLTVTSGMTTGVQIEIFKESNTGSTITITPSGSGTTLRSVDGANKLTSQYGVALIVHKASNVFTANGNLTI